MPPELMEATLLYEDRSFYRHPGVNPLALLRSVGPDGSRGRRMGGSTINMQVVRLNVPKVLHGQHPRQTAPDMAGSGVGTALRQR